VDRITALVYEIDYPIIADIGCDHGYTTIKAILSGKAVFAYACDINKGPLLKAEANIKKAGLSNKVILKLGNGLMPLSGTNVDSLIISGLGGYQIINILNQGLKYTPNIRQIILQPMKEIKNMRMFMHKIGYRIKNENIINNRGIYYFILNCIPGEEHEYSEAEYELGRVLMQKKTDLFKNYINKEINKTEAILNKIHSNSSVKESIRTIELNNRLQLLRKI